MQMFTTTAPKDISTQTLLHQLRLVYINFYFCSSNK